MTQFLIRTDAAKIPEIGTGHLIRSLTIVKYLIKKNNLEKKNFAFLVKRRKKYSISSKILKKNQFKIIKIHEKIKNYSSLELKKILRINFDIIIFDRIGKIKKKFLTKLKEQNKKVICLEDNSKNKGIIDLSINSLIFKKNIKKKNQLSGFAYNIIPSILEKKNKIKKRNKIKKILIFFGGYDHKKIMNKLFSIFKKFNKKFTFCIPDEYDKIAQLSNVKFYNNKNFFNCLKSSDLVICSGGLIMFDSIANNIPTICVPQYNHQLINIKKLEKKGCIKSIKNNHNIIKKLPRLLIKFSNDKKIRNNMLKNQIIFNKSHNYKLALKKINDLQKTY